jgi:tetratricopeptide (TPR) repeat protein
MSELSLECVARAPSGAHRCTPRLIKRPHRNLLIILSALAVTWMVLMRMPSFIAIWIAVALFVFGLGLLHWARDFMIGRYRTGRRDWLGAAESFERFEKKLLTARWSIALVPLYLSIYTFDGVAIARNNIGQSLMSLKEYDRAVHWLRSALQRDPLYAIPYLNLGTIAALRGDEANARVEFRRAVELGYSPTGAQELLRRALANANRADRDK